MSRAGLVIALFVAAVLASAGCERRPVAPAADLPPAYTRDKILDPKLAEVARAFTAWAGVQKGQSGAVFVNLPQLFPTDPRPFHPLGPIIVGGNLYVSVLEKAEVLRFNASTGASKTYTFGVRQTYADGSVVNWDGAENSDDPAPTVEGVGSLGGGA